MIFKEINGFEADLIFVDGKWTGRVSSLGPFWSSPARDCGGRLRVGMKIEFVRRASGWVQADSSLPWFFLDPDKGEIEHYR